MDTERVRTFIGMKVFIADTINKDIPPVRNPTQEFLTGRRLFAQL